MRHCVRSALARHRRRSAPLLVRSSQPIQPGLGSRLRGARRKSGQGLAAVSLCAAIVAVAGQLGGSASAHPGAGPALIPATALGTFVDVRGDLGTANRPAADGSQVRHLAALRASRAQRTPLVVARPQWARPTWLPFTSPFGPRWGGFHPGIDFTGPIGTPVFAAGDGWIVTPVGTDGYGNVVAIAHPDGSTTWYAHLSQILVTSGHVDAGQTIGLVGNTGWVTGPHLHFEVRYHNTPVDPVPWLRGHGIRV